MRKASNSVQFTGLCVVLAILCMACQSYQVGGTIEPWEEVNKQAIGVFITGDSLEEYWENTLVYFPERDGNTGQAIGYDNNFKYPFNFAGNHFSIFPMLGLESRYFISTPENSSYDLPFGIGVKIGAGADISLTRSLFLRGKFLYQPAFTSFFASEPGFRFSLGLGYRTKDSDTRIGFKTYREMSVESALRKAKEQFENKNYNEAISQYERAIELKATLGNSGITNLSASYYERSKQNQANGDYRQALEDFNESLRRQYAMSRQKFMEWKEVLLLYEGTYGSSAPHGNYGKLIFPANDNMTIRYDRGLNGQTDPNEIVGNAWNYNLLAGRRTFDLGYDEPNYNRGYLVSDRTQVSLEVEAGHIYLAEATVIGNQVTITITDVTNSELGKSLDIGTAPVFKRTLALREERPQEQNVTITIENNTGFPIHYMYISSSDSTSWGSDVLGSREVIRNKSSRKVTLPPLNIARRYDIRLEDKDGDTYTKWNVIITPNMTINFRLSDIDF